ncbi:MAG: hypothetical protein CFH34_00735 [Alphaproteobacteria bacterium MarineAlpha9_Bin4]|nr:MAG: hypothetical protein CFH34_00735 [Alphaproteobacteria bacterium MarineAlpha9_Bin4]
MDFIKKINLNLTQKKFYIIVILILIFISLQLDGINDKLNAIIKLSAIN